MHQKLTEHEKSCMQNKQLLTKTSDESKDSSIVILPWEGPVSKK